MRELKFRVWSDYWKKYAFDVELYPDGSLYAVVEDDGVPHHENTDLIIEQYTGLKDKNGKEIYEGDIVEVCAMKMGGEILFSEYYLAFRIEGKGEESLKMHLGDFRGDSLLIIGNIHENPELLEEK